jgi:aspartyl-tRNA(Asn)/glutamyl-tRNA(Gln) amidotransferase subunit A
LLGTSVGQATTRRTFLALMERALPVGAVDAMAAREPAARTDGHPISDDSVDIDPLAEGPLSGERVAIKDTLDVAGLPTLLGMDRELLSADHHRVEHDAELVKRIRMAGGIIRGKARMTELGMDGIGALMPGAMPDNGLSPGYIPGGSSTGTAVAVARGMARYGLGGDGLGSVRIPAAFQGLVGLKPSLGTLPARGYRSVAPSMDVPGPMAKSVADCTRLFQVLAGLPVQAVTPQRPTSVGLIAGLGPELSCADQRRAFHRMLDAAQVPRRIVQVEGADRHAAFAVACSTSELAKSEYAASTRSGQGLLNIAFGRSMAQVPMESRREALRRALLDALKDVEVLAMPTTAIPAPAISRGLLAGGQDVVLLRAIGAYTPLANLTGFPAIAVPSGRDARGRALSLMLMGAPGSELKLLAMAAALEATEQGALAI